MCGAIRDMQGRGLMPDGSSRFSIGGEPITTTWAHQLRQFHCGAGDRAGENSARRALIKFVTSLWCHHGIGAVMNTAKVEAGATVGFRFGGHWPQCHSRRSSGRGRAHYRHRFERRASALAERFGMTDFINPNDVHDTVQAIVDLTDGGVISRSNA